MGRSHKTTRMGSAAAVLLLAVSLAACAGAGDKAGSPSTLTLGAELDPAPFGYNPADYSAGQDILFDGLYQSLAVRLPDGEVGPGLATDFAYNEDQTELTLTLRDDVTFTDGSELDAELVKANLDRRDTPELVAYNAFAPGGATEILSVEVVDDDKVAMTFAAPQPGFESSLVGLSGMIVGQSGVDDRMSLSDTPAGSGPYVLDSSTVKGSEYVMVKNVDSPEADAFPYDRVVIKPIPDAQARVNAVISGQVDASYILTSTAPVAEEKGMGLAQIGGSVVSLLVFDKAGVTSKPLADVRVRRAISSALDREAFVDGLHKGDIPATNALPADSPGFDAAIDEEFGYNPERARTLLAEAGYPDGFEFSYVASPESQTDLVAIQSQLAEVGVTMNLTIASSTEEWFSAITTTPLGYLGLGWGDPAGVVYGVILGFADPHQSTDPVIGRLTGDVLGAPDDATRAEALSALNRALVESGTIIPVFEQLTTWAYDPEKIAPVVFPGTVNTPLLGSFAPAE